MFHLQEIIIFLVVIPFIFGILVTNFSSILVPVIGLILALLYILKRARSTEQLKRCKFRNQLVTRVERKEQVDLSVVIPAYNEEKRLPPMLDETLGFLETRQKNQPKPPSDHMYVSSKFTYETIVVDDGSTDKTTDCVHKYRKKYGDDKVRIITLPKNCGKGAAVRAGVLAARGNYIMFADADGASKFSDIEKLERFMHQNERSKLLVAIGSRAHMEEEAIASRSLFRTILMKGFHFLVWTCCVRTVRDTQCGFKMFNRQAAELLFTNYHNESWAFDVELLYLAEQLGCKIGEIPVNWREIEGSKIVPVFSWIRMGWDVLCLATFYTIGIYHIPRID